MARLVFMGSKAIGHRVLGAMLDETKAPDVLAGIVCPDDRDDPRSALPSFERTASEHGIRYTLASDRDAACDELTRLAPDVVIVCGWYSVIPVLRFPRAAFYGLHAGLLPKYRGGSPLVWQIINGEDWIGLSLFRLTPRPDAGDVVDQDRVPLGPLETIADALVRIEHLAVRVVRANLHDLIAGTARHAPQDHAEATTFPQRRPSDGHIEWSWPSERVHDFIRAQTAPYPGAFTRRLDGRIVRVWRSEPVAVPGRPGHIVVEDDGRVIVGCGEGSVRVLAASFDGDPAGAPSEVLVRDERLSPRGAAPSTVS